MAQEIFVVDWVIKGVREFGSKWRNTRRPCELPRARAATAYSLTFSTNISPRIRRAYMGTNLMLKAITRVMRVGGKTATQTRARTKLGKASTISITRIIRLSILPPRNPEMLPSSVPTTSEKATTVTAINRSYRLPCTTREKISRPYLSRPHRWARERPPFARAESPCRGLYGAIHGASRATPSQHRVMHAPSRKSLCPAEARLTVACCLASPVGGAGDRRTGVLICAVAISVPIHVALA